MKTILKMLATALFLGEFIAMGPRAHAQGGVPLWTNRYNGPGNGYDLARAIAVDTNGNVFVTGSSYGSSFPDHRDYATVAYSSAGAPMWTNRYKGSEFSDDYAHAIAVDSLGNVFVTGYSGGGSNDDYATVAYSNAGVPLWTNRYNGPMNGIDRAIAVAVDNSGKVFVTGYSAGTSGYFDNTTLAYSVAGLPLWTNRYEGPADGGFYAGGGFANAIAVDSSGNVFVTGYSGAGPNADSLAVAYSGAGAPLWTNRYNGPGGYDQPRAIVMDSSGNSIVTGSSDGVNGKTDYATIKYSSVGLALWTNRYAGFGFVSTFSRAMGVDRSGNVFVTGQSAGIGTDLDYATVAYSAAGAPLWTNRYNGQGNSSDGANAVVVDRGGNVLVTGASIGSSGYYDYLTVAYSTAGIPLWTNRYNGAGNDYDEAMSMTVDGKGNLLVTGVSTGNGSGFDYVTIKYSSILPLPVHLDYQRLNNELVLTWENTGFGLQSAPNITGTFNTITNATSPYTNPAAASQRYFRLKMD